MILGIIGLFFAGGVGAGYFASLVDDEEVRTRSQMENDIYNYEETSEIYFSNNVFLGEINSDLYREEVTLNEVSDNVKEAIIATEDEYFQTHNGIVPKAILRAVYQEATNSAIKTGGSTLTQQIIKNQILTNEVSFERKAKEILLALRLERFFEKDEILEAYLNIVPFGRNANGENIAGIQTAAQGIFGINAEDINLAQAAFIAGLPQSPSYYTPFTNSGDLKSEEGLEPGLNRMNTVLERMLEGGYITQSQYEQASNYDITADFTEPSPSSLDEYPFLTNEVKERAIQIVRDILAIEDGYTEEDLDNNETLKEEYTILAGRELSRNGYKVHTTIDKEIYDRTQDVAMNFENYGPAKEQVVIDPVTGEQETIMEPVQVGSIIIENSTGKIISFVGGRDFDEYSQVNHATDGTRQNGSTMKPLLVYAPAMEEGVIQPGTIIADTNTTIEIPGSDDWTPRNYARRNFGLTSVRDGLYNSRNVPAAKTYMQIIDEDPVKNYLEKMGFSSLTDQDHSNPSMALGSLERGVTVEENTNAFATFGNDGKFVDAYMIEKIETDSGEVIYQHEKDEVEVFSPQTAYLTTDILRDVLDEGTGRLAKSNLSNPNVDWAGKTGTTNDDYDSWFMGFNPNVTMGVWLGYDHNKRLPSNASTTRLTLWAELVNAATEGNPELMAPSERFERPGGIVSRTYCITSGLLPSELCTELGLVETDIFNAKHIPDERDDSLINGRYVMVNGQAYIADENTPEEFIQEEGVAFNPEWLKRNDYDKLDDLSELIPNRDGVWEDIALPSTDEIEDDGKRPQTPEQVEKSDDTLIWNHSDSKDVVGYRIYQADHPDASFQLVGNTTNTEFSISDNQAVYHVTAVDYYGQESEASNTVEFGDFSDEPEPEIPDIPDLPNDDEQDEPNNPDDSDTPEESDSPENENENDQDQDQDENSDSENNSDSEEE